MKKVYLLTAVLFVTMGVYSQKPVDTTRLEGVTIQGNRFNTPLKKTIQDVQVLTAKQIKKLPVSTLNELLTYAGGVDLRQRGPFGTQADISMDGGTFEEVLVLLNGIKLINSQTAHNLLNLPIPIDAIDHIEIIRGTAARKYGINALTGAINIVTKKSSHSFLDATVYAGSSFKNQDPREGNGIYGGGGIQVTGNFGTEKQQHLFSFSKEKYNGQRYNSAADNTRLFYNGNFNFNQNHSIHLLGGYSHSQFGANGFYAAPGDSNSCETVTTALFSISSKHQLGRFTLTPRISNRYDEDEYRYFKNNPAVGRSMHYTNALMLELNGSVQTTIGKFGLGWESRFGAINSSNIGQHKRNNHGIYAEYKGSFFHQLIVGGGAYINYNTKYGWKVYPGIDVAYLFLPHWKLSVNAGSGQRLPSFTDLYLNQLPGNIGNPNLHPEDAWEYTANIDYSTNKIHFTVGYFYRDITNFIDWVRDNPSLPYSTRNYGRVKMQGIHARISQSFPLTKTQNLGYFIKYSHLFPGKISSGEKQSKYVLETLTHQLVGGVNYKIGGFSIQVTNRFIQRINNSPYDLLGFRLKYKVRPISIFIDVTNVLDAQYKEAGAVPMPSRWFKLGVKYHWDNKEKL